MKLGTVTFLVLLALPSLTLAEGYEEEWIACEQNSDCVKSYACEDIAVNKNFVKDFEAAFDEGCDAAAKPNPKAIAQCVEKECTIVIPEEKK